MKKSKPRPGNEQSWRFFRAGGFDQVRLDSAKDLLSLEKLDQKLWVALACPVDNVHFDTQTLSLIDTDKDKRIRASELIAAIKWICGLLKNPEELIDCKDSISVQSINDTSKEGSLLAAATRTALKALGKDESGSISVAELQTLEKCLSEKTFNGDGIITEDATTDETLKKLINDVISVSGSVVDRSGKPGINSAIIDTFFKQANDYNAWITDNQKNTAIRPCGTATEDAAKALSAVKDKIDDYFTRCAIAEYDTRIIAQLNGGEKEFATFCSQNLSLQCSELVAFPLARIEPNRPLPLSKDLNPSWIAAIASFKKNVLRPLIGNLDTLSLSDWESVRSAFDPWFTWQKQKPDSKIDTFGINRVQEILAGNGYEEILKLIELDKAESAIFESLADLEKLVRFHRDLYLLCTNFVNFKDFYAKGGPAIFQVGTLYLDQRSCNLCIKISDANKHSLMAAMAGTYLVYCDCRRQGEAEKLTIVAAFTNGDSDNLMLGRNGIFYDRNGKDWDATIIKIIENPISLRQAFWLPYKSLVRMIESQVAKRAAEADAQSTSKLSQTAITAANADKAKIEPIAPPKKLDVGIIAALGVAAGALGTFVATLFGYVAGIVKLGPLAIVGAFIGLLALISGPSIIIAYIKLRKRNLGPILDAGGWAINARTQINVPFGAVLTKVATVPPGSQRDLRDPYAQKRSPWPKVIVFTILIYVAYSALNHFGFINEWSQGRIGLKKEKAVVTVTDKNSPDTPISATQP